MLGRSNVIHIADRTIPLTIDFICTLVSKQYRFNASEVREFPSGTRSIEYCVNASSKLSSNLSSSSLNFCASRNAVFIPIPIDGEVACALSPINKILHSKLVYLLPISGAIPALIYPLRCPVHVRFIWQLKGFKVHFKVRCQYLWIVRFERSLDIESKLFLGTPIERLIKSPVLGSMIPLNCGKHPCRSVMEVGDRASGR